MVGVALRPRALFLFFRLFQKLRHCNEVLYQPATLPKRETIRAKKVVVTVAPSAFAVEVNQDY